MPLSHLNPSMASHCSWDKVWIPLRRLRSLAPSYPSMLILCHTHLLSSSHVRLLLVSQTPQVLPCLEFSVCIVFSSAWNFPSSKFFVWIINTHTMSLSLNIIFVGNLSDGPQPLAELS